MKFKPTPLLRTAALLIAMSTSTIAAPPPGADPALHEWFEKQHNVGHGWCCSLADGHILSDDEWRTIGGNYEVLIDGQWRVVDPYKVRDPDGGPNPTGHAIVWIGAHLSRKIIYCFAPGHEG